MATRQHALRTTPHTARGPQRKGWLKAVTPRTTTARGMAARLRTPAIAATTTPVSATPRFTLALRCTRCGGCEIASRAIGEDETPAEARVALWRWWPLHAHAAGHACGGMLARIEVQAVRAVPVATPRATPRATVPVAVANAVGVVA